MEEVVRGTCEGCGKVYRVPQAGKVYRCKACGGSVRVAAPEPEPGPAAPSRSRGGARTPVRTRSASRSTVAGRARARKKSKTGLVMGIVGVALVGVAAFVYFRFQRQVPLESVVDDLQAAWNGDGPAAVAAFCFAQDEEAVRAGLEREVERRAWADDSHPQITGWTLGSFEVGDDLRAALLRLEDGIAVEDLVQTSWQAVGNRWRLSKLVLPIGDLPDRFVEAWNDDDLEAVAAFFEDADDATGSLQRLCDRRGWDVLPAIESFRTSLPGLSTTTYGETEEGVLEIVWGNQPLWHVRGVRAP